MKIGFIGTGVMGSAMIKNLLKADFAVTVYNRTKEHAQAVIAAGATWLIHQLKWPVNLTW